MPVESRNMRMGLLVVEGPEQGVFFSLDRERIQVGKAPYEGARDPLWVYLLDPELLPVHAVFEWSSGRGCYTLISRSRGSIRVNGVPVLQKGIREGDLIGMGAHTLQAVTKAPESLSPPSDGPDEVASTDSSSSTPAALHVEPAPLPLPPRPYTRSDEPEVRRPVPRPVAPPPPLAPAPAARTSTRTLSIFFRSLSALYDAGIRIDRALEILAGQLEDTRFAAVVGQMEKDITSRGIPLHKTMEAYQAVFGPVSTRLVQTGEMSGQLGVILQRLADFEEKRDALKSRIVSRLAYPACLFVLSVGMLVLAVPRVLNTVFRLLADMGGELPFLTKAVLGVANLVHSWWFPPLLCVAGIVAVHGFTMAMARPALRLALTRIAMRLPMLGRLLKHVAVARFTRCLATTLSAGLAISLALKLSSGSTDNPVLEQQLPQVLRGLEDGRPVSDCLAQTGFFPSTVLQMVAVGEETGDLSAILARVADLYDESVEFSLDAITSALEPMIMVFLGGFVALILLSVMVPLSQLIQHL